MRERLAPHYERHHLEFRRRQFQSKLQKAVREHPGLIIPVHTINHRLLHLRVQPMDAPSDWLLETMYRKLESHNVSRGRFASAMRLVGELQEIADRQRNAQKSDEAFDHAFYIQRQLGYATLSFIDAHNALDAARQDNHEVLAV